MAGIAYARRLYADGLGYTLVLNALGIGLLVRAWNSDLWLFGGATHIPRWLLVLLGVLLQIPGVLYLAVGAWAACSTPGVDC